MNSSLQEKNIALAITGGIAAYRAVDVANCLIKAGGSVRCLLTEHGRRLAPEESLAAITNERVITDGAPTADYRMDHISLAEWSDLLLVCPATANTIGKAACGIADDVVSTTLMTLHDRVLWAPAMNTRMWANPAVAANVRQLRQFGQRFVGPVEGRLACGDIGEGHLAPIDDILLAVEDILLSRATPLRGRRIVISGGRTTAAIDPVRYISNRSSGRMGVALAKAARKYSSQVVFIHGQLDVGLPSSLHSVYAETNEDMYEAISDAMDDRAVLIMAAAPVDMAPRTAAEKADKHDLTHLELSPARDILTSLNGRGALRIGFALETEPGTRRAQRKRREKGADMIVLNRYEDGVSGFGSETNQITIIDPRGETAVPLAAKDEIAYTILDQAAALLENT